MIVAAVAYVQRVECRTIYLLRHDLESLSDAATWRQKNVIILLIPRLVV
jgi:hypothetical protein